MKHLKYFFVLVMVCCISSLRSAAQPSKAPTQPAPQALQTVKIKVTGITCKGDCKDIQESIGKLNGITATQQIGKPAATSVFVITFDPALVTEKQIYKSVEDTPGCDDPEKRPYKVKKGDK